MRRKVYLLTVIITLSISCVWAQDVSVERLDKHISTLSNGGGEDRTAGHPGGVAAAEYIAGVFEQAGLKPFFAGSYIDEFSADPLIGSADKVYRNVAGIIYGSSLQLDGEYIILGAHYDYSPPGQSPATVIEDNTSGVAALLEMAYALQECSPGRNVVLVAFDGFELGLLGSRRFLAEGTIPAENIALMLDMQRVGSMHEERILYAYTRNVSQTTLDYFLETGKQFSLAVNNEGYSRRTDTEAFTSHNIPTIHLTCYPVPTEDFQVNTETIDTGILAEVTQMVAQSVCNLSNAAAVNKPEEKSGRGPIFEGGINVLAGTSFVRMSGVRDRGKTMFSYGAGIYGQLNVSYFGLRPEVQFIRSGSRYPGGNIHQNSLVLPLSLVFQSPPALPVNIHLYAGGYYRYTFGGKYAGEDMDFSGEWYRNGAGIQWGLGLRLNKVGIGVNNRYGLTDMKRTGSHKMTERATYCTISYTF